jgi:hypothetical protein
MNQKQAKKGYFSSFLIKGLTTFKGWNQRRLEK